MCIQAHTFVVFHRLNWPSNPSLVPLTSPIFLADFGIFYFLQSKLETGSGPVNMDQESPREGDQGVVQTDGTDGENINMPVLQHAVLLDIAPSGLLSFVDLKRKRRVIFEEFTGFQVLEVHPEDPSTQPNTTCLQVGTITFPLYKDLAAYSSVKGIYLLPLVQNTYLEIRFVHPFPTDDELELLDKILSEHSAYRRKKYLDSKMSSAAVAIDSKSRSLASKLYQKTAELEKKIKK